MVLQMLLFLILCLSCWNSYFSSLSFSSSIIGNTTRSEMSWRVKIIFFSKIWSAYLLFIVVSGQIWDLQPIAMSNPSSPFSPVHTYKRTIGWRFYDGKDRNRRTSLNTCEFLPNQFLARNRIFLYL